MNYYLLDGVGAGFFLVLFGFGIVFIIVVILLEAWIMRKMKYSALFSKAFLDSLMANILSLGGGFVVLWLMKDDAPDLSNFANFALFFVMTLLVECLYLFLVNRDKPFIQTLKVCALMNVVTYLIALVIIQTTFY